MVDAAVGGKTGINFNGLKNEIGAFAPASSVLIDCNFLRSLDHFNILSGYAEMLKHGLISNVAHWSELLTFDLDHIDYERLQQLVGKSVMVKEEVVKQDPLEKGLRKALNLGHTVGHAFESFALQKEDPLEKGLRKALNLGHTVGHAFESFALQKERPVLHGYAVAWGLVCELYFSHLKTGFPSEKMRQTIQFIKENYGRLSFTCKLHGYAVAWGLVCELYFSHLKTGFPSEKMRQTIQFIKENYGRLSFTCKDYDCLYEFMKHDKKNAAAGVINFTLLSEIGAICLDQTASQEGAICLDQTASQEEVNGMLDFYSETMG